MKQYLLYLCIAMLFASCRTAEAPSHGGDQMSFTAQLAGQEDDWDNAASTRGAVTTSSNISQFATFCYHTNFSLWNDVKASALPNKMFDQLVSRSNNEWKYNPPVEWLGGDGSYFTFFGYSPRATGIYQEPGNPQGNNIELVSTQTDAGTPVISYKTMDYVPMQVDMLIAAPVYNTRPVEKVQMKFQHALSQIRFKAWSQQSFVKVKSITIKDAKYIATFALDGSEMTPSADTKTFELSNIDKSLSTDADNMTDLSDGSNAFMLLPQDFASNPTAEIIVKYMTGTEERTSVKYLLGANTQKWEGNKSYTYTLELVGNPTAELMISGVNITDWNIDSEEDLSTTPKPEPFLGIDYTTTPANSYIAYPDGGAMQGVKFDATLKPRSKTSGLVGHQGYLNGTKSGTSNYYTGGVYTSGKMNGKALTEDLNKADIAKIEVVWQTLIDHGKGIDDGVKEFADYDANAAGKAFIKDISYDATTGYCSVSLNGTGNALIAAYDAAGTILWSWHIWGTDTKPEATIDPGNDANGAGKKFMDRNLGALSSTATKPTEEGDAYKYFGLTYQWGRKEPFTGAGPQYITSPSTDVNSIPTAIFDKSGKYMAGQGTKPIKNTAGGYTHSGTSATSTYTLLSNPTTYYNGPNAGIIITDNPNTWTSYNSTTVAKSIYDPCPYGYRVPIDGSWIDNFPAKIWTRYTVNEGISWKSSWWPAAGYRNRADAILYTIGDFGNYWSSSPHSEMYKAYYLNFNYNNGVYPSSNSSRSNSFSIRCVEE